MCTIQLTVNKWQLIMLKNKTKNLNVYILIAIRDMLKIQADLNSTTPKDLLTKTFLNSWHSAKKS